MNADRTRAFLLIGVYPRSSAANNLPATMRGEFLSAFWGLPGKTVDTIVDPAGRSARATSPPQQM